MWLRFEDNRCGHPGEQVVDGGEAELWTGHGCHLVKATGSGRPGLCTIHAATYKGAPRAPCTHSITLTALVIFQHRDKQLLFCLAVV